MSISDMDKLKIRTAVKCYLKLKGKATAKQLVDFINGCDLRLQCRLTSQILAIELKYCMTQPNNNFLKIGFEKDKTGRRKYYLL